MSDPTVPPSSGAHIVEVGAKPSTVRAARAEAVLTCRPDVVERVRAGIVAKGDALRVAEVAALFAMKRTSDLLPMCHPLALTGADVRAAVASETTLRVVAQARTQDRTGVEMEVLTSVSIAALTLYDMLKMYDPAMVLGPIRLLEKTGGKNGDWRAPDLVP